MKRTKTLADKQAEMRERVSTRRKRPRRRKKRTKRARALRATAKSILDDCKQRGTLQALRRLMEFTRLSRHE